MSGVQALAVDVGAVPWTDEPAWLLGEALGGEGADAAPGSRDCLDALLKAFDDADLAQFHDGAGLAPIVALMLDDDARGELEDAMLERLFDPTIALVRREHLATSFACSLARGPHNGALLARLDGDDEDDRIVAARALGSAHNEDALAPLARALSDESPRVREACIDALSALALPAAGAALAQALPFAPTRAIAQKLLAALAVSTGAQGAAAWAVLCEPFLDDDTAPVRRSALRALAALDGARARRAARSLTADADPGVRLVAAACLGGSPEPMDVESLLALGYDEDPRVRAAARDALPARRRPGPAQP